MTLVRRWDRNFVIAWIVLCAFCAVIAHGQVGGVNGNNAESQRAAARRAAIASARGQLEAAQVRMKAAEQRIKADAKADPQMTAAETELDQAQADLDRLGAPVLAKLRENNAEYQAALKDEADAQAKLSHEQAKAVAEQPASTRPSTVPAEKDPQDDVTVAKDETSLKIPVPTDGQVMAATDKLDVRSRRRELEQQALAADPSTAQASARVDAATAKLKQLHAELDAKMLNDPEYKAARDQLATASAEVKRAASAAY